MVQISVFKSDNTTPYFTTYFAKFFYDTLEQTGCKKYLSVVVLEDIEEFEEILEDAARQWYDFIDDAPERKTGEGFAQFFREIREQKL